MVSGISSSIKEISHLSLKPLPKNHTFISVQTFPGYIDPNRLQQVDAKLSDSASLKPTSIRDPLQIC